ncbi:MAG: hypothetical protein LBH11_04470 [Propionibacteriaceae bacterium]|jgi:hypothetical protein|nr:hypothetical protein [Propionibacteriaceae bacterium]
MACLAVALLMFCLAGCQSTLDTSSPGSGGLRPNEIFAECVNARLNSDVLSAEPAPVTDRVPDFVSVVHHRCVLDPLPYRDFLDAVQACYAVVPEYEPVRSIPAANFDFAYCLLDQGIPAAVYPYDGDVEYWRCEGTPEGVIITCGGGTNPVTTEEIAAAAVCAVRVPGYMGQASTPYDETP